MIRRLTQVQKPKSLWLRATCKGGVGRRCWWRGKEGLDRLSPKECVPNSDN